MTLSNLFWTLCGRLKYPARIIEAGDGYEVRFRDFSDVSGVTETREQAIAIAVDVLQDGVQVCFLRSSALPPPSRLERGEVMVALPLEASRKARRVSRLFHALQRVALPASLQQGQEEDAPHIF